MNIVERRSEILSIISDKEFVTVEELAEKLEVTKVTIRSDLAALEERGDIVRTHGGATVPERRSMGRLILNTMNEFKDEKMRIARKASGLLVPDSKVFIDSGSTAVHMVRYLSGKRITMITGSLIAATEAVSDESIEVMMFGGMLRRFSMGTIGGFAGANIGQIHADIYFMGATSYTADGVYSSNLIEAETKKSMIRSSDYVCLLADSSKAGKKSFAYASSWKDIDCFVTDAISDELRSELEGYGVKVLIAD